MYWLSCAVITSFLTPLTSLVDRATSTMAGASLSTVMGRVIFAPSWRAYQSTVPSAFT